jgi:hypothetical protein
VQAIAAFLANMGLTEAQLLNNTDLALLIIAQHVGSVGPTSEQGV